MPGLSRRVGIVLVPMCLAVMLVVAVMTSLNLALPDIAVQLRPSKRTPR